MTLSPISLFRAVAATFATTLLMLALAANAFAATEIGSRCTASGSPIGTLIQTATATPGETYVAPVSGVVTRWGSVLPTGPIGLPSKLKTVRPTADPAKWLIVSESATMTIGSGPNEFARRVPIAAGDTVALFGSFGAVACLAAGPADVLTGIMGATDPLPGETHPTSGGPNARVAVWAVIEPDVDGDGFGDETQDLCTVSSAIQVACPPLKLKKFVLGGKKSFDVLVTANGDSTVTLTGSARVPAHGGERAATIKFKGVAKIREARRSHSSEAQVPAQTESALRRLPARAKVKLTLKLTGVGAVNTHKQTIRASLRGQR